MNRLLLAGPVFLACLGTASTALLLLESFDAFVALAIARSHAATSWHPAAVATPCPLALTGWGRVWRRGMSVTHVPNRAG